MRLGGLATRVNTTDLIGEYGDSHFIINRGDSRISITIARDAETVRLGRENRFLVDDYDTDVVLAYRLTKPLKMGMNFDDDEGVFKFVLTEVPTEDTDNLELHIPNYYQYFPREEERLIEEDIKDENGRKVWI